MTKAKLAREVPAKARKSTGHAKSGSEGKAGRESKAGAASKPRNLVHASVAMGQAADEEDARHPKAKSTTSKPKKPKTREGKKGLVLYIEPEGVLALRRLALDNDSDVQRMGRRALELLFAEYGRAFPASTEPAAAAAKS
ncbi:MAG: hypothetical protein JNM89_02125 [Hyphomicrobiaceae bacterium]|nr:hypothetical protein [Hyphomicrobiaceae bacterium]